MWLVRTCLLSEPTAEVVDGDWQDKRLAWYDMDLSTKPYKVLRYHAHSVSGVAFHRSFPLFASSSDDATVHVFHGMVYQVSPSSLPLSLLPSAGPSSVPFPPSLLIKTHILGKDSLGCSRKGFKCMSGDYADLESEDRFVKELKAPPGL